VSLVQSPQSAHSIYPNTAGYSHRHLESKKNGSHRHECAYGDAKYAMANEKWILARMVGVMQKRVGIMIVRKS